MMPAGLKAFNAQNGDSACYSNEQPPLNRLAGIYQTIQGGGQAGSFSPPGHPGIDGPPRCGP
jgi:hypothetical protein